MLRILRVGKDGLEPLSIKEQAKLCKEDPSQNPGRLLHLEPKKGKPIYPGLRPIGKPVAVVGLDDGTETERTASKEQSSSSTKRK